MKKLIFLLVALTFAACKTSQLQESRPACIQEKIDDFTQNENSWQVEWTVIEGDAIYHFKSVTEDVYLNEKCDTVCQYAFISSYLPPCKIEIDNAADWQTVWEK